MIKRRRQDRREERETDGEGRDDREVRESYLVKGLRAEWCWMYGVERWRGCGRDRAPGAEKTRRASRRRCPIPSSAGRALPNQYLWRGRERSRVEVCSSYNCKIKTHTLLKVDVFLFLCRVFPHLAEFQAESHRNAI